MMATYQGDALLLTALKKNNLTSTGRSNYIHSTYVAYQTAKWCFDSVDVSNLFIAMGQDDNFLCSFHSVAVNLEIVNCRSGLL